MYSFLVVQSRIKPAEDYDFFTYDGPKMNLDFRGRPVTITKGTRFGVRKSSSQKAIRLVLGDDVNRVFTIDLPTAKKLAKHIRREG